MNTANNTSESHRQCPICTNHGPVQEYARFVDWGKWEPLILCAECARAVRYPTREQAEEAMRSIPSGTLSYCDDGWGVNIVVLVDNHFKEGVCLYCGERRSAHPSGFLKQPVPGSHEWRMVSGCAPEGDKNWDPDDIQESVTPVDRHPYNPFSPEAEVNSHRIMKVELRCVVADHE